MTPILLAPQGSRRTPILAPARGLLLGLLACVSAIGFSPAHADPAQLTVQEGVVVKFGSGSGIKVRDGLRTENGVLFTAKSDDTGGAVLSQSGTPHPGDWEGLVIDRSASPAAIVMNGTTLRYGGATGGALSFAYQDFTFRNLEVSYSQIGILAAQGGNAQLSGLRLTQNGVGLQTADDGYGSRPTITASQISGNTRYGIFNGQTYNYGNTLSAQNNWWGDSSGPKDSTGNPAGRGNAVSSYVDYRPFLTAMPLAACWVTLPGGYTTRSHTVDLNLTCPGAARYRISEKADLSDASYAPLVASTRYDLSLVPGSKTLYVQFQSAAGDTLTVSPGQTLNYAPAGPVVSIQSPAEGASIGLDTAINVTATDVDGVANVAFYVDGAPLATVSQPPYQATWAIAAYADGSHTLKAVATGAQGLTAEAAVHVTLAKGSVDATGPSLSLTFNGASLVDGQTLTSGGTFGVTAADPSGVSWARFSVDGGPILGSLDFSGSLSATRSMVLGLAGLTNGPHTLAVEASDGKDNRTTRTVNFTYALAVPTVAAVITNPANNATVSTATLAVSGTAPAGASVQVLVDGNPAGSPVVAANGGFSASVPLTGEGGHSLTAAVSNSAGSGPLSAAVQVNYVAAPPTVSFVSPGEWANVTGSTVVEVAASDSTGITRVDLYADGFALGTLVQPPYRATWDATAATPGSHSLKAVATNGLGKTREISETVMVVAPTATVTPPPTSYTGRVDSITPATSYGTQAIVIAGQAVDRNTGAAVANAALKVQIKRNGFIRTFNLVADASGHYSYSFQPQGGDGGYYTVSALHPSESSFVEQGNFTVSLISFNQSAIALKAARGTTVTLPVTATASADVSGVKWVALPANQPSGALPPGITVDGGAGVSLTAGASAPVNVRFTSSLQAGASGSVFLTAVASESGSTPRGSLRIDYTLTEALPALYTTPTYVETGVQQGNSVSTVVTLSNRGLVDAQNVRLKLTDQSGNAPPAWVSLVSGSQLGVVEIGAKVPVQVSATAPANLDDGIYVVKLAYQADNDPGNSVPISFTVTKAGQGGVTFDVADLYTNTVDKTGKTIPGLAGASIKLQHETVASISYSLSSDANGLATLTGITPGVYLFRASAPNHKDLTGRIMILPGVTVKQHLFLEYQLVSVEFSVTETTVQDTYNITLTATYQTEVPAPVVLLEPLSINLPILQAGEVFTGELTLTNYGLVAADSVTFTPPKSDDYYRYEFLADIPSRLPAKTRIVIPYRVTGVSPISRMRNLGLALKQSTLPELARLNGMQARAGGGSCLAYSNPANVTCYWTCANGDQSSGQAASAFSNVGGSCSNASPSTPSWQENTGGNGGNDPGGYGYGGNGASIPLANCTPVCHGPCCQNGGSGGGGNNGNGSGGNGSSGAGGGPNGPFGGAGGAGGGGGNLSYSTGGSSSSGGGSTTQSAGIILPPGVSHSSSGLGLSTGGAGSTTHSSGLYAPSGYTSSGLSSTYGAGSSGFHGAF